MIDKKLMSVFAIYFMGLAFSGCGTADIRALEERVEKLEGQLKSLDEGDTEQWGEIREMQIDLDEHEKASIKEQQAKVPEYCSRDCQMKHCLSHCDLRKRCMALGPLKHINCREHCMAKYEEKKDE